jgi:cell wall-associated NlpC family hydrolase
MERADAIVAEAKSWLNTPYVPRALIKGVGVDCGGLLYKVYEPFFGPFPPFPQDYSADWAMHEVDGERYLDFIMPYVKRTPAPVVGGFSVFHYGRKYAHGAIYIGDDWYIHAWGRQREGRVCQSKSRAMMNIGDTRAFPPKHYEPK